MPGFQTRKAHGGQADTSGRATARDLTEERRARRERDAPYQRAYEAGQRGDDPAEFQTDDRLWDTYQDGARHKAQQDRAERRDATVNRIRNGPVQSGVDVANDGAGIILGLFAYALLVNYLQGGVKGARAWLAAKFLNRVSADAPKPKSPAAPSAPTKAGE